MVFLADSSLISFLWCLAFNILVYQWPSARQRAVRICYKLFKKILCMNSPFELQRDYKNDCIWTYVFLVELKLHKSILHYVEDRIFNKKRNQGNLHKNKVFSKRYFISYVTVMENYKWYFQNQFFFSKA